ncbi:transcription elongation protein SprT [Fulvivirgaceae bacterium BMA12]|uniref:Transcription elongation protein SprT n=1 Tax=Agaribacillus aureus TaxID=3051825 RepID=A0ABT8LH22_9BACT|nr:transcription elongation protein SprT [Fulvivirgaceae bacterium BMA12]
MMPDDIKHILAPRVPAASLDYCADLWHQFPFNFKVTRKRKTKLGDYRYHKLENSHTITVNRDLNIYNFLLTYVHEVAHLVVRKRHGGRVSPHGIEWKRAFQDLMRPLMNSDVFPEDILSPLQKYMSNPKATSYTDPLLSRAFRNYDATPQRPIFLADLAIGHQFEINGRKFKKLKNNRTRAVCRDLRNGKNYLISKMAEVSYLGEGDPSADQPIDKPKKMLGI